MREPTTFRTVGRKKRPGHVVRSAGAAVLLFGLALGATRADAYPMYDDGAGTGCGQTGCHTQFKGGPTSGALHGQHVINLKITTCNLCHRAGGGSTPVYTFWSGAGGGYGCAGCHGQDYGETSTDTFIGGPTAGQPKASGYGLRLVHAAAGVTICAGCHAPNPHPVLDESSKPPYYLMPGVSRLRNPCDSHQEDLTFDMDSLGLDNDGNGLRDYPADPNCPATTTTTTSTTTTTTTLPVECAASPEMSCKAAGQGKISINEKSAGKEKLKVSLSKIVLGVLQSQFGDPVNGTTSYALCVYNPSNALVGAYQVSRGSESCGVDPCWVPVKTTGYKYLDKSLLADGISKAQLLGGDPGKGKVSIGGKNAPLASHLPTGVAASLSAASQATVQFVTSDGECFGMTMNQVKTADGSVFSASAP